MNDTSVPDDVGRSAWLAALLSFIVPGVGQVYCGSLIRGLAFGLVYGLAIPVAFGLLGYLGPVPTVVFGLLAVAALFGVVLAAASTPHDSPPQPGGITGSRRITAPPCTC